MKEFAHELANLSSLKSSIVKNCAPASQKLQEVAGSPDIDESSIVLGVCAPALDKESSEIFQKYLVQQLSYGIGKLGSNWLQVRIAKANQFLMRNFQIEDIIFEFFEFGSGPSVDQPDVSHVDGFVFCFSKPNGLQSCGEFFSRLQPSKKPFQLFQVISKVKTVDHLYFLKTTTTQDSFAQLATKEFGEVKYEIIRSSQLLSPLLMKEQQNEARLERKFEEIINAAKASKSIGRMFSDGAAEHGTLATPDSTFSTLDKNSNFGTFFLDEFEKPSKTASATCLQKTGSETGFLARNRERLLDRDFQGRI
jgi:hypothetical protein